jgi:hypothetical protein
MVFISGILHAGLPGYPNSAVPEFSILQENLILCRTPLRQIVPPSLTHSFPSNYAVNPDP